MRFLAAVSQGSPAAESYDLLAIRAGSEKAFQVMDGWGGGGGGGVTTAGLTVLHSL